MTITQSYERMARIRKDATELFNESYMSGVLWRLLRRVLRRPIQLNFLDEHAPDEYMKAETSQRAVPIDKITGTSGRSDRFDAHFHPMQTRGKNRWTSVAAAMIEDITQIPPIELIQVGEQYYVVDGHHRVSAARAMRKAFIDARIIRWERTA